MLAIIAQTHHSLLAVLAIPFIGFAYIGGAAVLVLKFGNDQKED